MVLLVGLLLGGGVTSGIGRRSAALRRGVGHGAGGTARACHVAR